MFLAIKIFTAFMAKILHLYRPYINEPNYEKTCFCNSKNKATDAAGGDWAACFHYKDRTLSLLPKPPSYLLWLYSNHKDKFSHDRAQIMQGYHNTGD